jgi:hypothetical protein
MKRIVILQPGYLPWLGFFDLMSKADTFVIFDDVQYTVRDWRSRNRIKTPNGVLWLTVPVKAKGARQSLIRDVEIENGQQWQRKHLKSLESYYKKAKYFADINEMINDIYRKSYEFLIDLDMDFIFKVYRYCSLNTKIVFSSEIPSTGNKDDKLLSICKYLNATLYLSGNAARGYLRESIFVGEGINVEWQEYQHPYYNQLWLQEQGFISHLSIIDLLFNHGPDTLAILTGKKAIHQPQEILVRHSEDFRNS